MANVDSKGTMAIDTGGTFSDIIVVNQEGQVTVSKVPSTPYDPSQPIIQAVNESTIFINEIIHGTTVATNAVLERKGSKVAIVTTEGFADIIEIGRQKRSDIYAIYPSRPQPLVPSNRRFEVHERVNSHGEVETELSENDLNRLVDAIHTFNQNSQDNEQIMSIAVCTLFSFLNPVHEFAIKEKLKTEFPVSISYEIFPEYREYERISTTAMDAYVKPVISDYLSSIQAGIPENSVFSIMKSDKGLAMSSTLVKRPVDTLFSGLAGGIKATEFTSKLTNRLNLISLDIGGTSTDVASIINGKCINRQYQTIDGLPVARPAVDVTTIGAGGGSLVQYISGLVKVGPESAGADPGPIAYDKGGKTLTTTDIDLVFGVLPEMLAGGILELNKSLALRAVHEFAESINLDLLETITGIRRVFHENIAGAIRSVSTQRGLDPREFSLLCFGGAGPVHAAELAEVMGIKEVVIPPYPGIWSAVGLLGGDYNYSRSKGLVAKWAELHQKDIEDIFESLEKLVQEDAKLDNVSGESQLIRSCSMRFVGQSFDLSVSYTDPERTRMEFISQHREKYGFAVDTEPIEVVALRVNLVIQHPDPKLPEINEGEGRKTGNRKVLGIGNIPIYHKSHLGFDFKQKGPMIIEQDDTTIYVPPSWQVKLNKLGFIFLSRYV